MTHVTSGWSESTRSRESKPLLTAWTLHGAVVRSPNTSTHTILERRHCITLDFFQRVHGGVGQVPSQPFGTTCTQLSRPHLSTVTPVWFSPGASLSWERSISLIIVDCDVDGDCTRVRHKDAPGPDRRTADFRGKTIRESDEADHPNSFLRHQRNARHIKSESTSCRQRSGSCSHARDIITTITSGTRTTTHQDVKPKRTL